MSDLARRVVQGFAPQWVTAEVGKLYPNDITRYRLNLRGQRGEGILANPQWVLHEGDWVGCLGPHPISRQYLIVAYFGSVNPGDWFGDDDEVLPDLTSGQGPIPGFRPPVTGTDSLWYQVVRAGDEEEASRTLIPRPRSGDQPPESNDHYVRVIAGQPDPAEITEGLPGDGLPPSLGPFSAIGDRVQIAKPLPAIFPPGAYCIPAAQPAQQGDTLTYAAGTLLDVMPLGPGGGLRGIGSGFCGVQSDYTTLQFGTAQMASHTAGIEIGHLFYRAGNAENNRLYYLKFAPFLSDMFFCVGIFNGQAAVGIGREILSGMPYPYPSGGVLSEPNSLDSLSSATWFDITPQPVRWEKKIVDRDDSPIGFAIHGASEIYVKYQGFTSEDLGDYCTLTVSNGVDVETGARLFKTYYVSGQLFGGQAPGDLYGFGGDIQGGFLYGRFPYYLTINDREYPFIDPRSPGTLKGYMGEVGWHAKIWPGDPIPGGGGEYADDPGDLLPDAAFVWLNDEYVMMLPGRTLKLSPEGYIYAGQIQRGISPWPEHEDLPDVDGATHPLHPTVETLRAFLREAGATADDIAATDDKGYVSADDREAWDAAATGTPAEPAWADLSAQVTGSTRSFTTPAAYEPGSLRVRINSLELQNGREFTETGAQTFDINLRTPVATPDKDVVRAAYREA